MHRRPSSSAFLCPFRHCKHRNQRRLRKLHRLLFYAKLFTSQTRTRFISASKRLSAPRKTQTPTTPHRDYRPANNSAKPCRAIFGQHQLSKRTATSTWPNTFMTTSATADKALTPCPPSYALSLDVSCSSSKQTSSRPPLRHLNWLHRSQLDNAASERP